MSGGQTNKWKKQKATDRKIQTNKTNKQYKQYKQTKNYTQKQQT